MDTQRLQQPAHLFIHFPLVAPPVLHGWVNAKLMLISFPPKEVLYQEK
jgi:ABC-type molybdate transport system permease subunit